MVKTSFALLTLVSFLVTGIVGPMPVYAQDYHLPAPGVMVHLSPEFNPPILKGIKVHPDNPFRFDFILDKGDSKLSNDALKDESSKLIKYFLASLTIPENDLWVNLSPYEKDRIIPRSFGLTEMGRDLLAEDYMLKQITASLIYPEEEIGKKFWKRIYEEAQKRYGTTDVPVNTFNKVWIVPERAAIYENAMAGTAYVIESKLKVMLEQDYLSLAKHEGIQSASQVKNTNQLGNQIVREIVLPELTIEVNENKNFAKLRQVYNSLILATWYKKKIRDSILEQVYANKNKVAGVNIDPKDKEKIYHQYLRAFKKGVFNFIKEDIDPVTQETIPRKYFSGGLVLTVHETDVPATKAVIAVDNDQNRGIEEVTAGLDVVANQVQRHEDEGNVRQKVMSIVKDMRVHGIRVGEENGRFLIKEAVEAYAANNNNERLKLNGIELWVENGVLFIVGEKFKGLNHAGRGGFGLNVFVENEQKAAHELKELELWLDFAVKNNDDNGKQIMTPEEVEGLRQGKPGIMGLGERLRGLANQEGMARRLKWQNRLIQKDYEFHVQGLIAEAEFAEQAGNLSEAERERLRQEKEHWSEEARILVPLTTPKNHFDIFIAANGPGVNKPNNPFNDGRVLLTNLPPIPPIIPPGNTPTGDNGIPTITNTPGGDRMLPPEGPRGGGNNRIGIDGENGVITSPEGLGRTILDGADNGMLTTEAMQQLMKNDEREMLINHIVVTPEKIFRWRLEAIQEFDKRVSDETNYDKKIELLVRALASDEYDITPSMRGRAKDLLALMWEKDADVKLRAEKIAHELDAEFYNGNKHYYWGVRGFFKYSNIPTQFCRVMSITQTGLMAKYGSMYADSDYNNMGEYNETDLSIIYTRLSHRPHEGVLESPEERHVALIFRIPSHRFMIAHQGPGLVHLGNEIISQGYIDESRRIGGEADLRLKAYLSTMELDYESERKLAELPVKYVDVEATKALNQELFDQGKISKESFDRLNELIEKIRVLREEQRNEDFRILGIPGDSVVTSKSPTGGIDLTAANMNLQTRNAGEAIKFHLNPAQLAQLQNAPGFVPVIINIQPMLNLKEFLGLTQSAPNVG